MAIRNIRLYGDEILRKKCRKVDVVDDKIRLLMKYMADTMNKAEGAGLAAPQVGILKRLVVIEVGEGLLQLVNPEIIEASGSREVIEGCLSIKNEGGKLRWGKLHRPVKVKVRALDENGAEVMMEGEGELCKALCHVLDLLDGVLFVDKVTEFIEE